AVRDDAPNLALRAGIGPRGPGAAGAGRVPRALVHTPLRLGPCRVVSRRMDGAADRRLHARPFWASRVCADVLARARRAALARLDGRARRRLAGAPTTAAPGDDGRGHAGRPRQRLGLRPRSATPA